MTLQRQGTVSFMKTGAFNPKRIGALDLQDIALPWGTELQVKAGHRQGHGAKSV